MDSGRPLRQRRDELGLTQARLAARARVSRALVSAVEAGRHLPRVDAALALAAALETTAEALFGGAAPDEPVDALTGERPAAGSPLRVGFVGERAVSTSARFGEEGWGAVDAIAGRGALQHLSRATPSVVVAGCEPGLVVLERLLREHGTRAVAIESSSAVALAALRAGRLHAAAVHFPATRPPATPEGPPLLRIHLARWRVGLAAARRAGRSWWTPALTGGSAVIQREPEAAAQVAFERALRPRTRRVRGPRVTGHLSASRRCMATDLPAVTIEPAAAAVGAVFHPLEIHEVELWVPTLRVPEPGVGRLLELLASARYRSTLTSVGGYDLADAGRRVS